MGMREWMALLAADTAGRLRGYAAPFLSDAVQAAAALFLVRGGLAARGAVRRAVRRLAAGGAGAVVLL